jgi:hypothetical protein
MRDSGRDLGEMGRNHDHGRAFRDDGSQEGAVDSDPKLMDLPGSGGIVCINGTRIAGHASPSRGHERTHLMKKLIAGAAIGGALFAGGAVGAAMFGPVLANAQTTPPSATTPADATATAPAAGATAPTSNEETTHEANELAPREAAENNGTAFRGGHEGRGAAGAAGMAGHSNEDPTHEASESSAREGVEHPNGPATPGAATAPASGTPSTNI